MLWVAITLGTPAAAAAPPSGRVVDQVSGAGVAGARVLTGAEESLTGADGSYILEAQGPRTVLAPGYLPVRNAPDDGGQINLKPFTPRALYLTSRGVAAPALRDGALGLIAQGKANAIVIDIKDDFGNVVYPSKSPVAAAVGARTLTTIPDLASLVQLLRRRGVYAIARIVVFKDDALASHRPEIAVRSGEAIYRDREGMAWSDPFRRTTWDYNIAVAREAAESGFDEVQFDYLRFPDSQAVLQFAQPADQTARVEAITGFLTAARRTIAPLGVFTAADFFGYVCWNTADTGIGQQLTAIAGAADYLSPMLYPSGFHAGIPGYPDPVANAYQVIRLSLELARSRAGIPARRFRPWLQAFRDYAFDHRTFDGPMITEQIRAAQEFGSDGWMLWNARNRYDMLNDGASVAAAGCHAGGDGRAG